MVRLPGTVRESNLPDSDPLGYRGSDLRLARLARFLLRHKFAGVVLQILVAALCLWAVSGMRLRALAKVERESK